MTDKDISLICVWVNRGATLMVGGDPNGNRRVKVVRGPFGLFTKRFKCTEADLQRLRQQLAAKNINVV